MFLIITAIVLAVIIGVIIMIRALSSIGSRKAPEIVERKTTIEAVDVISDPLVYDGLTVEIESLITDWITKRSFTLSASEQGILGARGQLLIVSKSTFKLPRETTGKEVGLGETVNVHLKGRVRIMDRVELGRAMGLDLDGSDIRLDDNNIANWREGSVLLLTSVEKL